MYRTRGTMLGVVAAVAAAGLLAGCGDEESTATSTPTLSTSATASSASPAPAPAPGEQEAPAPEETAPEDTGAPAEPPEDLERPAPVEPEGTEGTELGPKEQAYLDKLAEQGVTPSAPDVALSIGSYVCGQVASGSPDEAMLTWVTAMAGADAAFDPSKMPVEQAGQIYIDTAKAHYCQ